MTKKRKRVLLALSWYLVDIHKGVARYGREHDWILHADMAFDAELPEEWTGDGVITLLGAESEEVNLIKKASCPVVDLSLSRTDIPLTRLSIDNKAVCRMAVEHFRERSFKNFIYYGRYGMGVDLLRRQYFKEILNLHGFNCKILGWEQVRKKGCDTQNARITWLMNELQMLPKPLACLTSRDKDGAELIDAALTAGIHVPEELAVLGINNSELVCDFLSVPLSSIDVGWERIGYEGAALLDRLMNGETIPNKPILLPPIELIVRKSSDILAVHDISVAKAMRYIWSNYTDPSINVSAVANAIFTSRSRLDKAFRKHLNRNVGEEIRILRLRHVTKLLLDTNWSLERIAHDAGFASLPHFYRTFKKYKGLTPRQYRLSGNL